MTAAEDQTVPAGYKLLVRRNRGSHERAFYTCWMPRPVSLATLAMLAQALLVVAAGTAPTRQPSPSGLIELTCNELQHLLATLLVCSAGDLGHRCWSLWRRQGPSWRTPWCELRQEHTELHAMALTCYSAGQGPTSTSTTTRDT